MLQEAHLGEQTTKDTAAPARPVLNVFRLTKDEYGVRPIALAGILGQAAPSAVAEAPVTSTSGAFNAFSTECTRDTQWVVSARHSRRPHFVGVKTCLLCTVAERVSHGAWVNRH